MFNQKFYVVWRGRNKGIYTTWKECHAQVHGYSNPLFKSFKTQQEAEQALNQNSLAYRTHPYRNLRAGNRSNLKGITSNGSKSFNLVRPTLDSIVVDGACMRNGNTEFRGINLQSRELIFHHGPFNGGTSNIGEFLAIMYALEYCQENGLVFPIYSDSLTAISWVNKSKINTTQERNEYNKPLFYELDRLLWDFKEKKYCNSILKWETKLWGENPADFGRKSGSKNGVIHFDTENILFQNGESWKQKFGEA